MVQDYITGLDESMIGSVVNMVRIDEFDYENDLVFTDFFDVDIKKIPKKYRTCYVDKWKIEDKVLILEI